MHQGRSWRRQIHIYEKIGEAMLQEGHDVDFMHCSSDNSSIDGIVVRDKKIAIIDGTASHVVDPINPGAVDSIIHFGIIGMRKVFAKTEMLLLVTVKESEASLEEHIIIWQQQGKCMITS